MGNNEIMCSPLPPAPVLRKPKMESERDRQWSHIKAIIAAIVVPKPSGDDNHNDNDDMSPESTPRDETATLLPKVVDSAAPPENVYGTFDFNTTTTTASLPDENPILPLHPNSLFTSAALTPVYLILMLLPMLPFWIFAGFLCDVAA